MLGLTPFLLLALPRPALPERPAPLGLLLPGKPEPRPCGGRTKVRDCADTQTHCRETRPFLMKAEAISMVAFELMLFLKVRSPYTVSMFAVGKHWPAQINFKVHLQFCRTLWGRTFFLLCWKSPSFYSLVCMDYINISFCISVPDSHANWKTEKNKLLKWYLL